MVGGGRSMAGAQHQLGLDQLVKRSDAGVLHEINQHMGDLSGAGSRMSIEGGQARWCIGAGGDVVEADHGKVAGHIDSGTRRLLDNRNGDLVEKADNCGGPVRPFEHAVNGRGPSFIVETSEGFYRKSDLGVTVAFDCLLEARLAKLPKGHAVGDGDKSEMAMTELVQKIERLAEGRLAIAVEPAVIDIRTRQAPMRYGGKVLRIQVSKPWIIFADAGYYYAVSASRIDDMLQD